MYQPLTLETVLEYVRAHPLAGEFLDRNAELGSTEIGDGNLNLVFQVFERSRPERSLLVKQALPYVRAAGESWPLSPRRALFEGRALELEHRHAPGLVPRPYWHDPEMYLNAMENLAGYRVVRRPLIEGRRYPGLGEAVGRFLAATLFHTSDFGLDSAEKKEMASGFANTELCRISEDLIFTDPYLENAPLNHWNPALEADVRAFQADEELKACVAGLKHRFMTAGQALLHGDLHTGSIMANDAGEVRVIDPEFAFFGPMGFDMGAFWGNLFLNAAAHEVHSPDPSVRSAHREYLLGEARSAWETFERGFRTRLENANSPSWTSRAFQDAFLLSVLRDAAGFAGAKMIRRIVGFAHVADLDSIEDETARAGAEHLAIAAARELIVEGEGLEDFEGVERAVRRRIHREG